MIKILTADQIREADTYTILNEPISSSLLMERAASKCAIWLRNYIPTNTKIYILCGGGNNGGDGLVIGRHLARNGFNITILIIKNTGSRTSTDFDLNLAKLKQQSLAKILVVSSRETFPEIEPHSMVLDAIFGSGLSRLPEGFIAEIIDLVNNRNVNRIAIDIPSGLFADKAVNIESESIFRAHHTLSFLPPKMSLLIPEHEIFSGEVHFFDIGLHADYIEGASSNHFLITHRDITTRLKKRSKFGHKGNYGHALIVAGSRDKAGAALLSAKACLRAGAGLVTALLPQQAVAAANSFCPEIMVSIAELNTTTAGLPGLEPFSVVGVGPGLGVTVASTATIKSLIHSTINQFVFDADALNILSENKTWMAFLKPGTILTPHPGEFERLVGKSSNTFEAVNKQVNLSVQHRIVIVRKGAHTTITTPDGLTFWNNTGNPGMATAGSGDVLTGILTALLAQGYAPVDAAIVGVWLHGMAGDLVRNTHSEASITANDIIEMLGKAFLLSTI